MTCHETVSQYVWSDQSMWSYAFDSDPSFSLLPDIPYSPVQAVSSRSLQEVAQYTIPHWYGEAIGGIILRARALSNHSFTTLYHACYGLYRQ